MVPRGVISGSGASHSLALVNTGSAMPASVFAMGAMRRSGSRTVMSSILANEERLKEVFSNLISNAFDFTDQGSIEISIQEKDAIIECSVSDTGRGIPEALLPGIFGKFQQSGKSYGPGAKGVGLGLAIAKAIVERHKGRIWVESKLGQGASFRFSLPKENTKS